MTLAETHADKPTATLVALAQRELHGDSPLSDDAGFARLQARMERPSGWGARGWLVGGVAVACAAALAAAVLFRSPEHHLTFEIAGGALGNNGHIVGKQGTRIRFSDGSEASLATGTEAEVRNLTEHGADVVLASGSMRVHIAKKPQASWKVAAGPYDVRVTGTAFDVSWSTQSQAFDLRMETGSVIVTGPLALGGITLRAGQHLFGGVAEGRLTVEGDTAPPPALPSAAPPSEPSAVAPAHTEPESVPSGRAAPSLTSRDASEAHAWTRQVAQGHFNAVLDEAEHRGLEHTLGSGSLEELAALADAARYAGRPPIAKRVLLAERQRFPGSSAAKDAAFFLGRLAEDGGGAGGAVEWYERYVTESPRGAYASQAFGRKMMLLYKLRGASAAKPIAIEYLAHYPNGPYAAAARKIDQESPTASKP